MYINSRHVVLGGTAAVSLAVGAGLGYRYTFKKFYKAFEQVRDEEVEKTIAHFEMVIDRQRREIEELTNPPQDLADVVEEELSDGMRKQLLERANAAHIQYNKMNKTTPADVAEALRTLNQVGQPEPIGEVVSAKETDEGLSVEVNIFDTEGVDEDPLDTENRDPTIPYVVTEDEFGENLYNHDQSSFVYYQGDDILTDQRDQIVSDVDETIGEDNLTKFGAGNRNPNCVYIRNERLGLDFEVTRVDGSYGEAVGGFIKHSQDRHTPRRFRGVDE